MTKRKYKPSQMITSLAEFEKSPAIWFEVHYGLGMSMRHRSALESLQVHTLLNFLHSGKVFACVNIEQENKEKDKKEEMNEQ